MWGTDGARSGVFNSLRAHWRYDFVTLIGIDFGINNSAVALWREGAPQLVPNALGKMLTASAVSLAKGGQSWAGLGRASRARLGPSPPCRPISPNQLPPRSPSV